jgi:hypothetical protein
MKKILGAEDERKVVETHGRWQDLGQSGSFGLKGFGNILQ